MKRLMLIMAAVLLSAPAVAHPVSAVAVIGTHTGPKVAPVALGSGSVGLAFLGGVGLGMVATGCILTNSCGIWTGNFRSVDRNYPKQSGKF